VNTALTSNLAFKRFSSLLKDDKGDWTAEFLQHTYSIFNKTNYV